MTTTTEESRHDEPLATALPIANFLSYFAIAAVEFSVPFVAVSTLGANSVVIAALGVCRFAPQVLLARSAAHVVERYDLRTVMLGSELLRVAAFVLSALALAVSSGIGLAIFAAANIMLACASNLTSVATGTSRRNPRRTTAHRGGPVPISLSCHPGCSPARPALSEAGHAHRNGGRRDNGHLDSCIDRQNPCPLIMLLHRETPRSPTESS
ncbi:hypothetical protein ACFV47_37910 [Streptomyces solisilvae]|uniref:hypothetical protein n=1 Tax=Streptomyces malaysiensis TaxID=92644 RepID=UPI0034133EB6